MAKSTFLVAAHERVDSLLIALIDESRPSTARVRRVGYLGDSDRLKDGMKATVTQAMCAEGPQGVLCLGT